MEDKILERENLKKNRSSGYDFQFHAFTSQNRHFQTAQTKKPERDRGREEEGGMQEEGKY